MSRFIVAFTIVSFALIGCTQLISETPTSFPPTAVPAQTITPNPTATFVPTSAPTPTGPLAETSRDGLTVQILKIEKKRIYMRVQADASWRFQPDFPIGPFSRFNWDDDFALTDGQNQSWQDQQFMWASEPLPTNLAPAGITYLDSVLTFVELPAPGQIITLTGNLEIYHFAADQTINLDLSQKQLGEIWEPTETFSCHGQPFSLGRTVLTPDLSNEQRPLRLEFALASNQNEPYELSSLYLLQIDPDNPLDFYSSNISYDSNKNLVTSTANLKAQLDENQQAIVPSQPVTLTAICTFLISEPLTLSWTMP